jgi:hypothetical protein
MSTPQPPEQPHQPGQPTPGLPRTSYFETGQPAAPPVPGQPPATAMHLPGQVPPAQQWGPPADQYGRPYPPPYAPPPRSKTPWIIGGIVAVVLALVAVALVLVFTRGGGDKPSATAQPSGIVVPTGRKLPPTAIPEVPTTRPATAGAKVGDCLNVTGSTANPQIRQVGCSSGQANAIVGKVDTTCNDPYAKLGTMCVAPVLQQGVCYDFEDETNAGLTVVDCRHPSALLVDSVHTSTTDPGVCRLPTKPAYFPELELVYCVAQP